MREGGRERDRKDNRESTVLIEYRLSGWRDKETECVD